MSPLGRGQIPMLDAARHAPIAASSGGRRVYHVRREGAEVLAFDVAPWEKVLGYCEVGGDYRTGRPPTEAERQAAAIANPASVAIDELPIEAAESWCTQCSECHLDADDENAHAEMTGHRATYTLAESFVARRAAVEHGFAVGKLQSSIADGMRDALNARARTVQP